MRNFNDVNIYPPLFREMADDIEECLASGEKERLIGCLLAICMVFYTHIGPAIEALKKEVGEEK